GSDNRWISLELVGVRANRSAIGARIELLLETPKGTKTLRRTVSSGGSFGSNSLRQEIGLGQATAIRSATIRWPGNNETQIFRDLKPNRFYRLVEGSREPEALERPSHSLSGGKAPHHHHHGSDPKSADPKTADPKAADPQSIPRP
ncbi:MAG: ASPIC/UnbV domain-containing protein, partial [Acidobacteriota bacterium]